MDVKGARVHVAIERLVLDGVAARDVPALRAAFEGELHALVLADADGLSARAGCRVARTRAAYAPPMVPSPRALGRALARAVFAGMRRS